MNMRTKKPLIVMRGKNVKKNACKTNIAKKQRHTVSKRFETWLPSWRKSSIPNMEAMIKIAVLGCP
jgi:hypothetical protein